MYTCSRIPFITQTPYIALGNTIIILEEHDPVRGIFISVPCAAGVYRVMHGVCTHIHMLYLDTKMSCLSELDTFMNFM